MKVANLCDNCKHTYPECKAFKIVFGIDCDAICGCVNRFECNSNALDVVIACDSFSDQRDL